MTHEGVSKAEDLAVNLHATIDNVVSVLRQSYCWLADPKTNEERTAAAMMDTSITALEVAAEQADQLETLLFKAPA